LDVNLSAVERLHRNQIYPIVLLLRFKSAKQIKEIKDSRYGTDKLSAKQAKEMYEHALKLESEYRQYISGELSFVYPGTESDFLLLRFSCHSRRQHHAHEHADQSSCGC